MIILSADTTAKTASVCVSRYADGDLFPLAESTVNATLTHSENLLPMIDFCLRHAALSVNDVDAFAVSAGPGSFTGVRIGVSAFKGLAFGRTRPVLGVSTLDALAYNLAAYPEGTLLLPVMDARREQFYNAVFASSSGGAPKRLCDDRVQDFSSLLADLKTHHAQKTIVLSGDGAALFYRLYEQSGDSTVNVRLCDMRDRFQSAYSVARASLPVLLCAPLEELAETCNAFNLSPTYLRASQAERERAERA